MSAVIEEDLTKSFEKVISKIDFEGSLLNRLPKCKERCRDALLNLVNLLNHHFASKAVTKLTSKIKANYSLSDSIECYFKQLLFQNLLHRRNTKNSKE